MANYRPFYWVNARKLIRNKSEVELIKLVHISSMTFRKHIGIVLFFDPGFSTRYG